MVAWTSSLPRLCEMHDIRLRPVSGSTPIDVESGEPMSRRRFSGEMEDIQGTFYMITRAEALAIKDFWRTSLKDGSLTFTTAHPVTEVANTEFMFIEPPSLARQGHLYNVSMSFRKMP